MQINKKKVAEYFVEFLGSFMFILIILLTVVFARGLEAFIFSIALAALIYAFSRFSKAHFNPILTIAAMINKFVSIKEGFIYILMQLIGAILAYPLANWIINQFIDLQVKLNSAAGVDTVAIRGQIESQINLTTIHHQDFTSLAFLLETLLPFLFVLTFLFVVTNEKIKNSLGTVLGLILFVITGLSFQLTGASFHPFRSLIPAVVECLENFFLPGIDSIQGAIDNSPGFQEIWLYLVAPVLGSILAALVFLMLDKFSKSKTTSTVKKSSKSKK